MIVAASVWLTVRNEERPQKQRQQKSFMSTMEANTVEFSHRGTKQILIMGILLGLCLSNFKDIRVSNDRLATWERITSADSLANVDILGTNGTWGNNRDGTTGRVMIGNSRQRVLLFVTTYASEEHFDFLRICWPLAVAHSILLQNADVLVFSTGHDLHFGRKRRTNLIEETFPGRNISIHIHNNPGYQEGAILAVEEALTNGWFDGYDWVVRLNPDVIIRNDTWIRESMNDPNIDAIFVQCVTRGQTDFSIFRPTALAKKLVSPPYKGMNAESIFTEKAQPILDSGRYKYLPGTERSRGYCKVRGDHSPVIHDHDYLHFCKADLTGNAKW